MLSLVFHMKYIFCLRFAEDNVLCVAMKATAEVLLNLTEDKQLQLNIRFLISELDTFISGYPFKGKSLFERNSKTGCMYRNRNWIWVFFKAKLLKGFWEVFKEGEYLYTHKDRKIARK